jgi:hypothetical protein
LDLDENTLNEALMTIQEELDVDARLIFELMQMSPEDRLQRSARLGRRELSRIAACLRRGDVPVIEEEDESESLRQLLAIRRLRLLTGLR